MKLSLVLLALFLATALQAADPPEIVEIRRLFNAIQSSSATSVDKIDVRCEEDEVDYDLRVRRYPNDLMAIDLTLSVGEHGSDTQNFYYSQGNLIFILHTARFWSFTGKTLPNGQEETTDTAIETRYYYANGGCIRKLEKEVSSPDPNAIPALLEQAPNRTMPPAEEAARLQRLGEQLGAARDRTDYTIAVCDGG